MKRTLTFYEDPGHGWLEVEMNELKVLGIADHISPYSYSHNGLAYLEEDVDYGTFMKAAKAAGWNVVVDDVYHENTSIRNYPSYPSHPNWDVLSGWKTEAA